MRVKKEDFWKIEYLFHYKSTMTSPFDFNSWPPKGHELTNLVEGYNYGHHNMEIIVMIY